MQLVLAAAAVIGGLGLWWDGAPAVAVAGMLHAVADGTPGIECSLFDDWQRTVDESGPVTLPAPAPEVERPTWSLLAVIGVSADFGWTDGEYHTMTP